MPVVTHATDNYVSRGGLKLAAALDAWELDVAGFTCADLGCSVGGFTDCLLQRGAARVYAVDTAYGQLAWKLRQDPRVVVRERENALHAEPPSPPSGDEPDPRCDLVVVDLGWTRQRLAVPAALRWLKPAGRIITLIKPHYESDAATLPDAQRGGKRGRGRKGRARHGVLSQAEAETVTQRVLRELPALGVTVEGWVWSPVSGGKGGNVEALALLRPGAPTP